MMCAIIVMECGPGYLVLAYLGEPKGNDRREIHTKASSIVLAYLDINAESQDGLTTPL